MPEFYDLCVRETGEEVAVLASELGWTSTSCDFNTVFLEADDWGELKQKIRDNREQCDVLVFLGGDEDLNRKAVGDSRVDVLLHPERGRKDPGIDHVVAEEAADNRVAIGFDLRQIMKKPKNQAHIISHWERHLELCEKYGAPYIITSGARGKYELRAPRDLASVINSLGFEGGKAVSDYPSKILERSEKVGSDSYVRPGVEEE